MHNHLAKIFSDQRGATRLNIRPCPVNGAGSARFRGTPALFRGPELPQDYDCWIATNALPNPLATSDTGHAAPTSPETSNCQPGRSAWPDHMHLKTLSS
jgi:hypothetical protein